MKSNATTEPTSAPHLDRPGLLSTERTALGVELPASAKVEVSAPPVSGWAGMLSRSLHHATTSGQDRGQAAKTVLNLDAVWQLVGAIGLGTAVGYGLDLHFGTTPWALLSGAGLGGVVGFIAFFGAVRRQGKPR